MGLQRVRHDLATKQQCLNLFQGKLQNNISIQALLYTSSTVTRGCGIKKLISKQLKLKRWGALDRFMFWTSLKFF